MNDWAPTYLIKNAMGAPLNQGPARNRQYGGGSQSQRMNIAGASRDIMGQAGRAKPAPSVNWGRAAKYGLGASALAGGGYLLKQLIDFGKGIRDESILRPKF